MDKKSWTRNQKLLLFSIMVAAIIGIMGWFIKIELNISYIQDEIKNIKIEKANIKSLEVDEFLKKCPPGTNTTTMESTNEGLRFGCE